MAEAENPKPKNRRGAILAIIGGSVAGLILLAAAGSAGLALGYHAGFRAGTSEARGNTDSFWPRPGDRPSHGQKRSPVGEWRGAIKGGEADAVRLTLSAGGQASGNDGCNSGGAPWELKDNQIHFGSFTSTKMFCEGVDSYLFDAQTAKVSKDGVTLKLFGEKAKPLGELHRSSGNGGIVPPTGAPDPRPSFGPNPSRGFDEKQRLEDGFKFRKYEDGMRERLQRENGN